MTGFQLGTGFLGTDFNISEFESTMDSKAKPQHEHKFVFVHVNEDPDAATQKKFRAHAMRETLRRKRLGTKTDYKDAAPIPYKFGRYRLAPQPGKAKQKRKITVKEGGGSSSAFVDVQSVSLPSPSKNTMIVTPSQGRLDPFNSAPIKLGLKQQQILHYYSYSFTQNTLAFNSKHRWISLASSDPAWLHSMLSVVALSHDLQMPLDIAQSVETLFHKGEALCIVQERLNNRSVIDDSTIGAVASLASREMMNGNYNAAAAHIDGLDMMVSLRGGLNALPKSAVFLRKIITWSDISISSMTRTKPRFPLLEGIVLTNSPADTSTKMNRELSNCTDRMCAAIKTVEKLSAIMEDMEADEEARTYFSLHIYKLQYELVQEMAEPIMNTLTNPEICAESLQNHSTTLAICIYINSILREIPIRSRMHLTMVRLLRASFDQSGLEPLEQWKDRHALLLWILFVGASTAGCRQDRKYFAKHLVLVSLAMGLTSYERFRGVLKGTAWVQRCCNVQGVSLWREMNMGVPGPQQTLET